LLPVYCVMKILILSTRLPYPQDSGAKIRAFQLLKALVASHEVTLLTFYGSPEEEEHFAVLGKMGVRVEPILYSRIDAFTGLREIVSSCFSRVPFTVGKYRDRRMTEAVAVLTPKHDVIYCEHMHMAQYLSASDGKLKVLDAHNVEAQIAERLANIETNPLKKLLLVWNYRAMRRYEDEICRMFDLILAVSEQDRVFYRDVYRTPNAVLLENGVDLDYFQKLPERHEERVKLVFVGTMGWMPNSDGVKFFVAEVLPLIRAAFPEVEVDIVGKNPPADVQRLAEIPGVHVTGTIDDVRPYVWSSQVVVVPLRFGGGTRLKILEAFAMCKPVVSTTLGCEGIGCTHDKDILIADSAEGFARAVIRLLQDARLRERLSGNAFVLVERCYSWLNLGRKLLSYFEDLEKNMQHSTHEF